MKLAAALDTSGSPWLRLILAGIAVLGLGTLIPACSCEGPRTATQVMLIVDGDEVVRRDATSLAIVVHGGAAPAAGAMPLPTEASPDMVSFGSPIVWPVRIPLVPENRDATRLYRAIATATGAAGEIAVARVISGYQAGEVRTIRLFLRTDCPEACPDPGQTCGVDERDVLRCIDAYVPPADLDPYEPDGGMDAGMRDVPAGDVPGPTDAPLCDPSACDDTNPCTSDFCGAVGCEHAPEIAGTSCANAEYCDGLETCDGAGACMPSTPPCPAAACDEVADSCMCSGTMPCPDPTTVWGACGETSATAPCSLTGTRMGTETTYTCVGGMCSSSTRDVTDNACPRATDGLSCDTRCTWSGTCNAGGSEGPCRGLENGSCATSVCVAGSCMASSDPRTRACDRAVGTPCGPCLECNVGVCGAITGCMVDAPMPPDAPPPRDTPIAPPDGPPPPPTGLHLNEVDYVGPMPPWVEIHNAGVSTSPATTVHVVGLPVCAEIDTVSVGPVSPMGYAAADLSDIALPADFALVLMGPGSVVLDTMSFADFGILDCTFSGGTFDVIPGPPRDPNPVQSVQRAGNAPSGVWRICGPPTRGAPSTCF